MIRCERMELCSPAAEEGPAAFEGGGRRSDGNRVGGCASQYARYEARLPHARTHVAQLARDLLGELADHDGGIVERELGDDRFEGCE